MTLKDMLYRSVQDRKDHVAIRFKPNREWEAITYGELQLEIWRVAEQLSHLGVTPGDRVAIYLENCIEWPMIYFAIVGLGATAVPVDAKLQAQETAHILRDSASSVLVTAARMVRTIHEIEPSLPALRKVLVIDGSSVLPIPSSSITYLDYQTAIEETREQAEGENRAYDHHQPGPEDIASFIYTSGTTGRQKGAMITHHNFTANVDSCRNAIVIYPEENFLLILPLHHAFAFTGNLLLPLACGAAISMVQSLRTVGDNIREVSPSAFIGVPLLVEKMHQRIMNNLRANKFAWFLYRIGIRAPVRRGILRNLGGRLRIIITGGAPCDPEILRGFKRLGILILEGYGLTETSPVLSINPEDRPKPGTIGKPLPGVEIRIHEPDANGVGELAARGPNVMKGYYNAPVATEETLRDGWLYTGDLGFMDDDGYITITGRKKSLIVNREGKNIYPEEVETAVTRSPYILEALVLGYQEPVDNVGERVGIIVVPDTGAIDADAIQQGRRRTDREVIDLVREEVKAACSVLSDYKRPRKVQVRMGEFEKTSTGKVKRYLYDLEHADL